MIYILLGIIQGVTEFLPVSSSGHLVLAQHLLHFNPPGASAEIILHGGTLLATIIYFRKKLLEIVIHGFGEKKELRDQTRRTWLLVILAVIPTGIIGLLIQPLYDDLLDSLVMVGVALLITSLVLWFAGKFGSKVGSKKGRELSRMRLMDAILIGIFQGLAVTPGVSRTGMTISAALVLGVDRSSAATYSFLISLPIIAGANLLEALKAADSETPLMIGPALTGAAVAGTVGYVCLGLLVKMVQAGSFSRFVYYTLPLGLIVLGFELFR